MLCSTWRISYAPSDEGMVSMAPSSLTSERLGKKYPLVVCNSCATHKRLVQQSTYQPKQLGTSEVLRKTTAFKPMKRIFYADHESEQNLTALIRNGYGQMATIQNIQVRIQTFITPLQYGTETDMSKKTSLKNSHTP